MTDEREGRQADPVRLWREWLQANEARLGESFADAIQPGSLDLPAGRDFERLSEGIGRVEDAIDGLRSELRALRRALRALPRERGTDTPAEEASPFLRREGLGGTSG